MRSSQFVKISACLLLSLVTTVSVDLRCPDTFEENVIYEVTGGAGTPPEMIACLAQKGADVNYIDDKVVSIILIIPFPICSWHYSYSQAASNFAP